MNERIRVLAHRATRIVEVKHEGYRGNGYTEQVEFFDKEKFAELIVQECIEIVEPCRCGCICKTDVAITDSIIADIKEHFGIEE